MKNYPRKYHAEKNGSKNERQHFNKTLLCDLKYLVDFNHTGQLEVYHSLYLKYCPKKIAL